MNGCNVEIENFLLIKIFGIYSMHFVPKHYESIDNTFHSAIRISFTCEATTLFTFETIFYL